MTTNAITFDNVIEKLKERTIIDPVTDCWLLQGAKFNKFGHGQINYNYKHVSAHRLSAHLYLNLLDLDDRTIQVNHKPECPNPNCWNPAHLYLGSHQENMQDMVRKSNYVNPSSLKTHCPQGHPYDEENTLIQKDGKRVCRECRKVINKRNNERNRIHSKLAK